MFSINYRLQLPRHSQLIGREHELMEGLLWSDPKDINGCKESTRGAGFHFGPQISHKFLDNNNLSILIRSHECKTPGYQETHDDRVITIFSASYYSGKHQNKGAVIVFDGNDYKQGEPLKPSFQQFYASAYAMTSDEIEKELMNESLQQLKEKIFYSRTKLLINFQEFSELNSSSDCNTTLINLKDWEYIMKNTLKIDIPFISILPYLIKIELEDDKLNYYKFLGGFQLQSSE